MMRLGAWALALVTAIALAGCSNAGNGIEDAQGQSESGQEQPAQEGEPLAQRARGASQESGADGTGRQGPERRDGAMRVSVGGAELEVDWEGNQAVAELAELVAEGPLTIQMSMYGGWEQVGPIGAGLTSEDERITAQAGDIMLYSGDQIVVFYGTNSWAYTRLGRITDRSADEMAELLGNGDVELTISAG